MPLQMALTGDILGYIPVRTKHASITEGIHAIFRIFPNTEGYFTWLQGATWCQLFKNIVTEEPSSTTWMPVADQVMKQ
jgi:hypothetical protein